MPFSRFQRGDLRYFSKAFAVPTHAEIDDADTYFGQKTGLDGVTKKQRANRIVEICEKRKDGDQALIDALNVLYFDNYNADQMARIAEFRALTNQVLVPRGVLFDSGRGFGFDSGAAVEILSEPAASPIFGSFFGTSVGATSAPAADPFASAVTREAPASVPAAATAESSARPNSVFIVQGRDDRPPKALETFIHFLGMDVVTWSDARRKTGSSQPRTFDIVKKGLEEAGAVVVVFSPDEEARLRAELNGGKPGTAGFQPRQNVLLEAGLAYGMAPERTIFVRSVKSMREISDIEGFHFITMDGSWEQREALIDALRAARTSPTPKRSNLQDFLAGPFAVDPW